MRQAAIHVRQVFVATESAVTSWLARSESADAYRRKPACGDELPYFARRTSLRQDDAFSPGVQDAFRPTNILAGNANEGRSALGTYGKKVRLQRLKIGRIVLQIDVEKVDTAAKRLDDDWIGKCNARAQAELSGVKILAEFLHVADHRVSPSGSNVADLRLNHAAKLTADEPSIPMS